MSYWLQVHFQEVAEPESKPRPLDSGAQELSHLLSSLPWTLAMLLFLVGTRWGRRDAGALGKMQSLRKGCSQKLGDSESWATGWRAGCWEGDGGHERRWTFGDSGPPLEGSRPAGLCAGTAWCAPCRTSLVELPLHVVPSAF